MAKLPKQGETNTLAAVVAEEEPRERLRSVEVLLAEFRKESREIKEMVSCLGEKVTTSLTPKKGKKKAGTLQVQSYIDIWAVH